MKELEEFTIIIQGDNFIKVRTSLLESNLTKLYDMYNGTKSRDFNLTGIENFEDMIDNLYNCLGEEVDKENSYE